MILNIVGNNENSTVKSKYSFRTITIVENFEDSLK